MTLQDWGITYDELEPYYDKFEKMAGISGEPDPNYPERSDDYPTPPLKKNRQMLLFEEAVKKWGIIHLLFLAVHFQSNIQIRMVKH